MAYVTFVYSVELLDRRSELIKLVGDVSVVQCISFAFVVKQQVHEEKHHDKHYLPL